MTNASRRNRQLLLDQFYDLRRQMRDLNSAYMQVAPRDVRQDLAAHLAVQSR